LNQNDLEKVKRWVEMEKGKKANLLILRKNAKVGESV
jgi:hypothetical protein